MVVGSEIMDGSLNTENCEQEALVENRTSGRYRLNPEDKARPVPLKLHQHYIDRLEFMPGKNTAERIRNLIDSSAEWSERERRQIKEVKRLIPPLYRAARELVDPKIKEDAKLFEEKCKRFFSGLKSFEALLEILHFDISSLKNLLSERDMIELEIIFSVRSSLRSNQ